MSNSKKIFVKRIPIAYMLHIAYIIHVYIYIYIYIYIYTHTRISQCVGVSKCCAEVYTVTTSAGSYTPVATFDLVVIPYFR